MGGNGAGSIRIFGHLLYTDGLPLNALPHRPSMSRQNKEIPAILRTPPPKNRLEANIYVVFESNDVRMCIFGGRARRGS